jgi:hypothetical protein
LIPFKHKGKTGEIKFIGEIETKNSGNWVGVELDAPGGDCDGECDGNQLFQCKPGHGLFLRPTQVKSLGSPDVSQIAKVDESLISGIGNLGSMIGSVPNLDLKQIEKNLNDDPTKEVKVQDVDEGPTMLQSVKKAVGGAGGGRVQGWQDRLKKLREQKEQEKQAIIEQPREDSMSTDPSLDKASAIFAPDKALERDNTGKLTVDRDKVEEKKEPTLTIKTSSPLKEESDVPVSSMPSSAKATSSANQPKTAPARMSLMERQAKEAAEKKAELEAKRAAKAEENKELTMSRGGLKTPSRGLARPTAVAGGADKATEERKQKLLEKQKAVNAQRQSAAGGTSRLAKTGSTTASTGEEAKTPSRPGVSGTTRSRLGLAVNKVTEEAKAAGRLGSARKSLPGGGVTGVASRLTAGRASARPGEEPGSGTAREGAQASSRLATAATATSRARAGSKEAPEVRGIGGARGTSGSRKDDVQGLGKTLGGTRGTSRAQADLKSGTARERTGASKERPGLNFGKAAAPEPPKLDPSMTTIKKQELQDLKDASEQNEKHKEELYQLNIKYKQLEFQLEQLKRDHKDELDRLTHELTEKHMAAHEELIQKYSEERNELIRESNKSNDAKFNDLKGEYDTMVKERAELEEKLAQTIEDMKEDHAKDVENMELLNSQKFEDMKTELEAQNAQLQTSTEEQEQKMAKLVEKLASQKAKVENLEEELQASKIDLEANQIELDLVKDEKAELLAEMTESSQAQQDDVLNSLSQDEVKQQNRKLR